MLKELVDEQSLAQYTVTYDAGRILFFEGDESQDLYILVSGAVDIVKGKRQIATIREPGTLFGEMSFFMCAGRTATAKAVEHVKVIKLSREKATEFMLEFPEVSREIAATLAERLDKTTRVAQGLAEFCDQVPEAVLVADNQGKILTWNTSAQRMFQRSDRELRGLFPEKLFDEPEKLKAYINQLEKDYKQQGSLFASTTQAGSSRTLKVSGSTLRDVHGGHQGVLLLITDATGQRRLERRYRRMKQWFFLITAVLVLGSAAAVYHIKIPGPAKRPMTAQLADLGNLISKDYLVVKSLLSEPLAHRDREKTRTLLRDFMDLHKSHNLPYKGVLLLDSSKLVFEACFEEETLKREDVIGQSYGGIEFKAADESSHSLLCLYRSDRANPMGRRCTEIAMKLNLDEKAAGWVIFQMNMPAVEAAFGITEDDLMNLKVSGR